MPRHLATLLLALSITASVVVGVPIALAQESSAEDGATQSLTTGGTDAPNTSAPDGTAVYNAPSSATNLKDIPNIPISSPPPGVPMEAGLASVMGSIMSIFAWLLGVAVITLDNAVFYTVVTMGNVVNDLAAIGVAWRILRDIANIALIFGFLAIGISTILGNELYGWSSKLLPKLLMAAVFLNFSLFITEAIIDTGNLFATQFYTQINGGQPAGAKDVTFDAVNNDGIANKIMNQLGLQRIYGDAATNSYVFREGTTLIIGFMSIILFLVTAMVMFALAFILIARFVILVLLIVVSPIGFAGYAVPKLEGIAKQWSGKLIEQTITAPILLLALYVALAVITDAQFLTGFGVTQVDAWTGWVEGGKLANLAGVLLSFFVAIALLFAIIILSKKLGASFADTAVKWAGRASFGATAYGLSAVSNAAGRGTRYLVQKSGATGNGARFLVRGARVAENARLDVRRMPGVAAGLKFGGAGEAAAPIERSALGRVQQGRDWYKKAGKEADKQFDSEARMSLLSKTKATDTAAVQKIVRSMSEDEVKSKDFAAMLKTRPDVLKALTNTQVNLLSTNDLLDPKIHNNMTASQLEVIRRAGNLSSTDARTIGTSLYHGNLSYLTWRAGRTTQQDDDLRDFWGT